MVLLNVSLDATSCQQNEWIVSNGGHFCICCSGDRWCLVFGWVWRSFPRCRKINPESYIESAKSFQGGTYQFEGVVDGDLRFEASKGRLVSFRVSSSKGSICLPALIPASMNRINPQKGQSYKIKVVGRDYGLLVVEKIEKS